MCTLRTHRKIGSGHFHHQLEPGYVYIWQSTNWVIAGVNYIISYQQVSALAPQKIASWLFVMTHNAVEQSDWCDNMPIHSYDYMPRAVLSVNVSRPIFRQGHRAHTKDLVSGDETTAV